MKKRYMLLKQTGFVDAGYLVENATEEARIASARATAPDTFGEGIFMLVEQTGETIRLVDSFKVTTTKKVEQIRVKP